MGERAGTFAFLNTNGTTLTTGSIVPFRYVLGTGNLARNTNGGTVSLDSGTYIIAYSLGATAPTAGSTVTVTPEYGGALHPEYSRSFTVTAEGQSFELSDLLAITLPTDTSFSLNVTVNGCGTEPVTLTGVSASAIVYKVCDIIS